jgi:hypothetical protein
MSSDKVTFNELPEAGEVKPGDFFIIEDLQQTKKINFSNLIFGLDNVKFANTIAGQSTDILALSANVASLSAQQDSNNLDLNALLNTTVQTTTAAYLNQIYPIGSIMYTITNVNPQVSLVNTAWEQISQGLFVAGVGSAVDKNNIGFTVGEGNAASNFSAGEYNHTLSLAELASHTHTFRPTNGDDRGSAGTYTEYAKGTQAGLSPVISTSAGGSSTHNNIPPVFGVYVWQRIA